MKRLFVVCFACLLCVGCRQVRKYSRVEIYDSAPLPLVKTCEQSWVEQDYLLVSASWQHHVDNLQFGIRGHARLFPFIIGIVLSVMTLFGIFITFFYNPKNPYGIIPLSTSDKRF